MTRLNYFNFKKFENEVLITNDAGKYLFLSPADFTSLMTNSLDQGTELLALLKGNMFVYDEHEEVFCEKAEEAVRCAKDCLFRATSLFIFVVTNRCNSRCVYCQAQGSSSCIKGDMDVDVAHRAADIALASPSQSICIEFQGGEPLLNYPIVQEIIRYCDDSNAGTKAIQYSLVSNLLLLSDEMLQFFVEHHVSLSTSIDGNAELHNMNRPLISGGPTYQDTARAIMRVRDRQLDIGAIQTTTRWSLAVPHEIVDAYVDLGFHSIFLRPLTPLGVAKEAWAEIGYTAEEFVEFYRSAFSYILKINKEGTVISEVHATILLRKILCSKFENYMELRSPCGAAVGQVAFYYNGNIYTCDEGRMLSEMGNDMFRLGNVDSTSYQEMLDSRTAKAACSASILESLPQCCDCVYQPYCGTCPVINLASNGDIFPRESGSYRCKLYGGMLDIIFGILHNGDPKDIEVIKSWL